MTFQHMKNPSSEADIIKPSALGHLTYNPPAEDNSAFLSQNQGENMSLKEQFKLMLAVPVTFSIRQYLKWTDKQMSQRENVPSSPERLGREKGRKRD